MPPETWSAESGPLPGAPERDDRSFRFRPEDLASLKDLAFAARLVVEGLYAGRHRSRTLDRGSEFSDYRPYVAGDDIRTIDWRAVARSDRLYVKHFRKETDMSAVIVVDQSASMGFAGANGVTKLRYAAVLAASVGYLMLQQGDRAGFTLVDDELRSYHAPTSTWRGFTQWSRSIDRLRAEGGSKLAESLRKASPLIRRKGMLLVISDFLVETPPLFEALTLYLQRGFRVALFQVLTDDEMRLPGDAWTRYTDPEGPARLDAHPARIRQAYRQALERHLAALRASANARGIHYERFTTSTPCHIALSRFLATRSGQSAGSSRVA